MKFNIFKKIQLVSALLTTALICLPGSEGTAGARIKKIMLSKTAVHPALDRTTKGVLDELSQQGFSRAKGTAEIQEEQAQGSVVLASQIASKFVASGADVMVGVATTATQALVSAARKTDIPVVFVTVTDPLGSGIVDQLEKRKRPVTGVSNLTDVLPQLQFMKDVWTPLQTLGLIYNPGEANSVRLVKDIKLAAKKAGIQIVTATANKTVEVSSAARTLVKKADALYVTNDNTALAAFAGIVRVCQTAGKPVFVSDTDMVPQGALGAYGPDQYQLGRQAGRQIARILRGEARAEHVPVEFPESSEAVLNPRVMKRLSLSLSESVKRKYNPKFTDLPDQEAGS